MATAGVDGTRHRRKQLRHAKGLLGRGLSGLTTSLRCETRKGTRRNASGRVGYTGRLGWGNRKRRGIGENFQPGASAKFLREAIYGLRTARTRSRPPKSRRIFASANAG